MVNALLSPSDIRANPAQTVVIDGQSARKVIDRLLINNFILNEDWDGLPLHTQEQILACNDPKRVFDLLAENNLVTTYQAGRLRAGTTFGLVLGSYRILDRIGAGGMAIVFKAEHIDLRHIVAIKVLPMHPGQDPKLESRFFAEMRMVACLHHPNIVAATDAGRLFNPEEDGPSLRYLVMEYVPGRDLDEYVRETGGLPIEKACNLVYQIASALAETNKFNMVHRDIKPSNIMVTPEEQAKLLDFGLSRHFENRLTIPGTVLGTIDFMAPEQSRDASTVDIRADIYSLGGVMYWCLTGQLPFTTAGSPIEKLLRRLTQPPPSLKAVLADCPQALDDILQRMMATDPDERYRTPQDVMQAILPFLRGEGQAQSSRQPTRKCTSNEAVHSSLLPVMQRVLIVDDHPEIRLLCRHLLAAQQIECDEAEDGEAAIARIAESQYDLVLLDVKMPGMSGIETLKLLRESGYAERLKIIMCSGLSSPDEMATMIQNGADDYLTKPFSIAQFISRVRAALQTKCAQDRADLLEHQLRDTNAEVARLKVSDNGLRQTRDFLVIGLTRFVEQRDGRVGKRTKRIQRYCRRLAEAAARLPAFALQIDANFIDLLEITVPLHDIGKTALPDHIVLKSGTFSLEERIQMRTHTSTAAETLGDVAKQYPGAGAFFQMLIDVVRSHHERYDGSGYPDSLVGSAIPLAARIVAIVDVYDALRSRRDWKPALSHQDALQIIEHASIGQFDPQLVEVFVEIQAQFKALSEEWRD